MEDLSGWCKCADVFNGFEWQNIKSLKASQIDLEPGVYALRVINFNKVSIPEMKKRTIDYAEKTIAETGWHELSNYFTPRIKRLDGLDPINCPVIYLGATAKGNGNLQVRFKDLSGIRHTIFYPVFCMLATGWDIEYGWKATDRNQSFEEEKKLKNKYREKHNDKNPCLVKL